MSLLQIEHLNQHFGGVKAVDNVTLAVEPGEIHGLIGPNGSGKTTLFNCITGIYHPLSGSITFSGRQILGLPSHRIVALGISRTFQNLRLFAGMTVLENVMVARHIHQRAGLWDAMLASPRARGERNEVVAAALDLLDFCGIKGREDEIASGLPYGLQRRVEIARALAAEPRLLLLDEPAAGMNPREVESLKALVRRIRERKVTVFIIEHNVRLVMGLCDRVSVMDVGEVIADDIPERIMTHSKVIEAYLGRSET